MKKTIAINGFGRIGRLTLRNLLDRNDVEVVAINDLSDSEAMGYLFAHDSVQGRYSGSVQVEQNQLVVDGHAITLLSERDPSKLPWKKLGVDTVIEATGLFNTAEKAGQHLAAGAHQVILSAPAKSPGIPTVVLGVNDDRIDFSSPILSNASCTTNCLAPMAKIFVDNYTFLRATMNTIHSYTSSQRLHDSDHKDPRRGRAAALNLIPTSTGAAKATGLVLPEVDGKILAMAVRAPVPTGSMVELNVQVEESPTVEEVNTHFEQAAKGVMSEVLQYTTVPIVSTDVIGSPYSCIFDAELTAVMQNTVRVIGWYDNESGYSARLAEVAARR